MGALRFRGDSILLFFWYILVYTGLYCQGIADENRRPRAGLAGYGVRAHSDIRTDQRKVFAVHQSGDRCFLTFCFFRSVSVGHLPLVCPSVVASTALPYPASPTRGRRFSVCGRLNHTNIVLRYNQKPLM